MDSTNADYLLQNYKVSDVIQIQRKLKNDVDKKKSELKNLIGERYNELLEATDSIENMSVSVNDLIHSLKKLNGSIKTIENEKSTNSRDCKWDIFDYPNAILSKLLFDLPLKIWNALDNDDIILATYNYFYGIYAYKILRSENSTLMKIKFHHYNEVEVESLNYYIIEKCWNYIVKNSISLQVDDSKFADIFSCILLLKNCKICDLINEFYRNQTQNIVCYIGNDLKLGLLFQIILNIFINAIKCLTIFYEESNNEVLLFQRIKRLTNSTYKMHSNTNLKAIYLNYKIETDINIDSFLNENYLFSKNDIYLWIESVKEEINPMIQTKISNIVSVKEIFEEVRIIENKLTKDSRINELKECYDIDVYDCIWKDCALKHFENRVYEICDNKINSILNELNSSWNVHEAKLSLCDINIVDSIWKDSSSFRNNEFMGLVNRSCEIVNNELKNLSEDISILKVNYQNIIWNICLKIKNLLLLLKGHIDPFTRTKQFILFGAIFFNKIIELCTSIRSIFDLQTSSENDWHLIENEIISFRDSYFCNWFSFIIGDHFKNFNSSLFTDLNNFLLNLTIWENIPIVENSQDSNTTKVASYIEVPCQISLTVYNRLQEICVDINKYCTYSLPQSVLIHILSTIGTHLLAIYNQAIDQIKVDNKLPKAAKQTISFQMYFDLFFLRKLLASHKDERLRSNQFSTINDLISNLETLIDPFDLHIAYPHIQANSDKLFKSCYIIFGFLLPSKSSLKTNSNEQPSKEIKHNIMLVHSCDTEFGYFAEQSKTRTTV